MPDPAPAATEYDRLVAAHDALLAHLVVGHGVARRDLPPGSRAHADREHLELHRQMELAGARPVPDDGTVTRGRMLTDEDLHAAAHDRAAATTGSTP